MAQSTPAPSQWRLAVGAGAHHFSAVARDTSALSRPSARLRPSSRLGIHLSLARQLGLWEVALEVGWARGHAEAGHAAISIHDKSADLSRYRLTPSLGRRLTEIGLAEVSLALGPTLDFWRVQAATRVRIGGEIRFALRVPLGPALELENRATAGLSSSPVARQELGQGFVLGGLWTVSYGAGVRVRL